MAEYGDEIGDRPGAEGPPVDVWFEPGEGRRSVAALLEELRAHPEKLKFKADRSRSHWPAALLEDLEYCRIALDDAVARNGRFRLLLVP
jgi:hypothetical protein